ncbi:hypothetical protein [Kitasatospora sp. NPDC057223]|uniref:hypothetical protein n=1 Tax=Kitasatospora sp. NPDC057223 TaxID=3346055 RepID=UPI00362591EA
MIEWTERPGDSWWTLVRGSLAACWWRLLVVQVLFGGLAWTLVPLHALSYLHGPWVVTEALQLAAGHLLAAWGWSAGLRILDGGHGILSALRPDVRRIGRLSCWLVALDLVGVLRLLVYVDGGAYTDIVFSPAMSAIQLASLYLAFAAALLPMAVLLEGRGLRRAWRLSHGGLRAVLRVLPLVLLGTFATEALQYAQIVALGTYPRPSYLVPLQAAAFVLGVLGGALTKVLLYAAHQVSSRAGRDDSRAYGPSPVSPSSGHHSPGPKVTPGTAAV